MNQTHKNLVKSMVAAVDMNFWAVSESIPKEGNLKPPNNFTINPAMASSSLHREVTTQEEVDIVVDIPSSP